MTSTGATNAIGSAVLAILQPFVRDSAPKAVDELGSAGASVASALTAAAAAISGDAVDMPSCSGSAKIVESLTMTALQTDGWPHVCWREAYVMAQLLLCCADAAGGAVDDAKKRCERATILGALPLPSHIGSRLDHHP